MREVIKKLATQEDLSLEIWLRRRERGDIIWRTREGNEIAIKDMTDKHLTNAFNACVRAEENHALCFNLPLDDGWGDKE